MWWPSRYQAQAAPSQGREPPRKCPPGSSPSLFEIQGPLLGLAVGAQDSGQQTSSSEQALRGGAPNMLEAKSGSQDSEEP